MPCEVVFFEDYDQLIAKTAQYSGRAEGWLLYPALGLCGESGEVAEKVKKLLRNSNKQYAHELTASERLELLKECGDSLWYISAMSTSLGSSLQEVAQINADKLLSRLERGVVKSEGDNR